MSRSPHRAAPFPPPRCPVRRWLQLHPMPQLPLQPHHHVARRHRAPRNSCAVLLTPYLPLQTKHLRAIPAMSHMQTMAHNDALYESDHPIPARSSADNLAVSNPYTRQDQDPQTYALREAHALPTPSGPHSAFEAYVEGPGGVSLPSHRAYGPATTARNGTPPVAEQEGSPAPRRKSKLERSLEPSGYAAADTEGVQLDYADPTKTIRPHRGSPAGARAKVGPSRTSDDSTAGDAPSHLGRSGTEFLSRYNERNEAVLGSPRNGEAGILHDLEAGVANRTAAALQEAKDRGLATPAMIEHATAAPGVNP